MGTRGNGHSRARAEVAKHGGTSLNAHLLDVLFGDARAEAPFGEELLHAVAEVGDVVAADVVDALEMGGRVRWGGEGRPRSGWVGGWPANWVSHVPGKWPCVSQKRSAARIRM